MITVEIIDAMVASGCTTEQLAAVFKATLPKKQRKKPYIRIRKIDNYPADVVARSGRYVDQILEARRGLKQ